MYECGTCGYKIKSHLTTITIVKIHCKTKAVVITKSFEQNDSSDNEPICSVIMTSEFFEPKGSFGHTCNNCILI